MDVFTTTYSRLEAMSNPPEKKSSNSNEEKRDTWSKKVDFAFSIAGGFVGLGNVWRFPYLCFKNGGGAFLIPYVLFVALGSLPVFFLEVTVGQYSRCGGALAWKIVPVMKGIGAAVNIINYYLNVYYAVILAWSLRYFFASMASTLPWSTCGNNWNTNSCYVYGAKALNVSNDTGYEFKNDTEKISSVVEYWERGVLGLSKGIDHAGEVQWELLLCLLLTWVIIYFCIWKGIGWTSKVVYFTATFPILMLLVLLVRGVTLDGAVDGIIFYLKPDLDRLRDVQVWLDAAAQVFYSYALCKGMLTTMGSYNKYKYNSYRDCIILAFLNSGVSFVSGFAIFSVLGFMAKEQGVNITDVAESGPGLAFIAYPKALTLLPLPQFWGCLFFFMLFLLGLDSEFVGQETLMTAFVDIKPKFFRKPWRKEIALAILSLTQFLFGISMITQGGVYVLNIFDNYAAAGWCMLFISFFQCGSISWLFGIKKFWSRICEMVGFKPFPWFKWCWCILTPISTAVLFVLSVSYYKPLTYNKTYVYPTWAIVVAWMLALSSMLWIPGYAAYRFIVAKGSLKDRWVEITTSEYDDSNRLSEYEEVEMADKIAEASTTPYIYPILEETPLYEDVVSGKRDLEANDNPQTVTD
uniref:sodium- and chloride-dependent taurine transporter-like isoform X1 n=2 Tax=Styela clava TaxID=7725 RepID=UPI00193A0A43|nr:sodium- and chloride-dependent taurine transporter-like isoform X1 [Styela clava]